MAGAAALAFLLFVDVSAVKIASSCTVANYLEGVGVALHEGRHVAAADDLDELVRNLRRQTAEPLRPSQQNL